MKWLPLIFFVPPLRILIGSIVYPFRVNYSNLLRYHVIMLVVINYRIVIQVDYNPIAIWFNLYNDTDQFATLVCTSDTRKTIPQSANTFILRHFHYYYSPRILNLFYFAFQFHYNKSPLWMQTKTIFYNPPWPEIHDDGVGSMEIVFSSSECEAIFVSPSHSVPHSYLKKYIMLNHLHHQFAPR